MTIKVRSSNHAKSLTNSYLGKTVNQRASKSIVPRETIDDEIKEEINVVDDSDDEEKQEKLRKKFMEKMSNLRTDGRQSKTSNNRKRELINKISYELSNKNINPKQNKQNLIELEVDEIDDESDEEQEHHYF